MISSRILVLASQFIVWSAFACNRDPVFVVAVRNAPGEMIAATTAKWQEGVLRVGGTSHGAKKIFPEVRRLMSYRPELSTAEGMTATDLERQLRAAVGEACSPKGFPGLLPAGSQ